MMIKDFTPRLYQQTILGTAANKNTIVVLPTGMGKTAAAFLLAAQRLHLYPKSKILMLAPTKPLCEQHLTTFRKYLDLPEEKMVVFTGSVSPKKREEVWKESTVVISTPQCVTGETLIYTPNGPIEIKDFVESFNLTKKDYGAKKGFSASINEDIIGFSNGKVLPVKATKCWKLPAKELICIKTEMKKRLECTPEHPLLTINSQGEISWTEAQNLSTDSYIAMPNKISFYQKKTDIHKLLENTNLRYANTHIISKLFQKLRELNFKDNEYYNYKKGSMPLKKFFSDCKKVNFPIPQTLIITNQTGRSQPLKVPNYFGQDLAYIVGAMLADGHIGNRQPKHGSEVVYSEMHYLSISNRFKSKVKKVLDIEPSSEEMSQKGLVYYSTAFAKILEKLGVPKGNKSKKIKVPKYLFSCTKLEKESFLSGILNADGDGHKHMFRICSVSKKFIVGLQIIFLSLGITSSIHTRNSGKGKIKNRVINYSESYHLNISGLDNLKRILSFKDLDSIKKGNLEYRLSKGAKENTRSKNILPVKKALKFAYQEHRKDGGKTLNQFRIAYHHGYLSKNYLKYALPKLKSKKAKELLELLKLPFRWVKVKEIRRKKHNGFVYDLTVEKDHNFVSNGLISHNTVENDTINKRINLKEVSLLIFDEAHHATGDYAYVWIADQYEKLSNKSRILALTASPGSDFEKIQEVCQNLKIEKVEVRTEQDPDVKPYIQNVRFNWIKVKFPEELKKIQSSIKNSRKSKLLAANKYGYCNNTEANKTELLKLQGELQRKLSSGIRDFEIMKSVSLIAEALKVDHSLELLESQGLTPLSLYFKKLQSESLTSKVKAVKNLMLDVNFKSAMYLTDELLEKNFLHPKLDKLKEIVKEVIDNNSESKIIIFTQYRDSAEQIVKHLEEFKTHIFVGQAKKRGLGFSQKQQKEILDKFRNNGFNILIATSVAEEGLDIPKVDKVIFYEPVPSAIRTIQRKGRTGRLEKGEVTILLTEGTRDVGYRWASHHKEKRMYRNLEKLKTEFSFLHEKPTTLEKFVPEKQVVAVLADHREKSNKIVKELIDLGVSVKTAQLETADYLLSGKVGVELKKVPDFVASIIDGRLLDQVRNLRKNFEKAVLIIEGEEDIYAIRKVHANAIRGMLSSIVLDFQVPVLYTKNPKDTAGLLAVMAKREQDKGRDFTYHDRKRHTVKEQQEFLVSSLPNIGVQTARLLLENFSSIKNLVNASKEEITSIKGVGEKTADNLIKLFEEDYKK